MGQVGQVSQVGRMGQVGQVGQVGTVLVAALVCATASPRARAVDDAKPLEVRALASDVDPGAKHRTTHLLQRAQGWAMAVA